MANLIITDAFTPKTQGLAGAVFNVVAQFGTSIGLTIFAIISAGVTQGSSYENKKSPEALMLGYRAVFWTCFGLMMAACCFGAWGLRKVGKVGLKREWGRILEAAILSWDRMSCYGMSIRFWT